MNNIVIIGAGGFGREVAWLIDGINKEECKWKVLGFIDENINLIGKYLNGYKVLGNLEWLSEKKNLYYVCAIGNSKIKKDVVERCREFDLIPANLVHPSVIKSPYVSIGPGSIICAGSILTVNIKIAEHVIINLDCTVGHDVEIGAYSTIYPSANISGNVRIEEGCEIGTGSAIIQGKVIGNFSKIGAGATVISDIPNNSVAVGCPAKVIKESY